MPRPSRNLDRRLVAAARAMLPQVGFSGLKVRAVARRAGVNPGMFHYHFRSKEAFLRAVLADVYEDFFVPLRAAAEGPGAPLERLRGTLVAFARFARENRVLYTLFLRELLNGRKDVAAFARAAFPRHVAVLLRLLEDCRRAGAVRPLPPWMLAMHAMSTMGIPNIAVTGLEMNGIRELAGTALPALAEQALSDGMIETRADMVLASLAPGRRR
ncbi:MAG: TetR/AcrR family transcriptional regulator [Elusimicrobia bacterium]|nr:TetR/AcrR family transcriptional regulator [Elusimicrobiota bacterium]